MGKVGTDQKGQQDFPGGPVVRSLPTNAGNAGWIPGQGRFHRTCSSWAHTQLPSWHCRVQELQPPKPESPRGCASQQEKALAHLTRESPCTATRSPSHSQDPAQPKLKKKGAAKNLLRCWKYSLTWMVVSQACTYVKMNDLLSLFYALLRQQEKLKK